MKILSTLLLTTVLLSAQVATNITVTVAITTNQLTALNYELAKVNSQRATNGQPSISLEQATAFLLRDSIKGITYKYDKAVTTNLVDAFNRATPAQQAAALQSINAAPLR